MFGPTKLEIETEKLREEIRDLRNLVLEDRETAKVQIKFLKELMFKVFDSVSVHGEETEEEFWAMCENNGKKE